MPEAKIWFTVDTEDREPELLGFYADEVEALLKWLVHYHKEQHPYELVISAQVALGNVASNLQALDATIKAEKLEEDRVKFLIEEIEGNATTLASYMLQLKHSLMTRADDGKPTE